MDILDLSQENSLCSTFVAELRNVDIQHDPMRFRRNLERIGMLMADESSRSLDYRQVRIETPLSTIESPVLTQQPVIASILRAGLTLHQGLLEFYDRADNAFISAYRKAHGVGEEIEVEVEYQASPSLEGRDLILCDPMLATGRSLVLSYEALLQKGRPKRSIIACAIASRPGLDYIQAHLPEDTLVICAAIDPMLDDMSYIVPGLGDAGDLAYGRKT